MVHVIMMLAAISGLLAEDRVTQASYDRINLGMRLKEVRGILAYFGTDATDPGPPPRAEKFCAGRDILEIQEEGAWDCKPGDNDRGCGWCWHGQEGAISIRVDQNSRVTDRIFIRLMP